MTINHLIIKDKEYIKPFSSVESIEEKLLDKGYLVVRENAKYIGILTFPDIVKRPHNLVIDCLAPKKQVKEKDSVQYVFDLMRKEKEQVLPVFDGKEDFLGCIAYLDVAKEVNMLRVAPVEVKVENIIGDEKIESVKHNFIKELYHNTKNPIQIIYSALDMIEEEENIKDMKLLLKSIYKNTKKIDDVINGLYLKYFF